MLEIAKYLCYYFIIFIIISILTCLFLTIPILEIYFGTVYKHEIICNTRSIPLNIWLTVKGSSTIILTNFYIIFLLLETEYDIYCISCVSISILFYIFNFIWFIIGIIIYYNDCTISIPYDINLFICISLFSGFINLFDFNFFYSLTRFG